VLEGKDHPSFTTLITVLVAAGQTKKTDKIINLKTQDFYVVSPI
jgi:hypothetical protein